ncbi:MAG: peptidase C45 [Akkermansiaceae bacterium]|nr:peptidase C45 [Armatimonadota bacterium]
MALPSIHLTGDPLRQGETHGRALRDRIAHNLALYFHRFEREIFLSRGEVLALADRYALTIAAQSPDYFAQMQGVSEGSGFPLGEIVALNIRYEILYFKFGEIALATEAKAHEPKPDGCTAFALQPEITESGHLLMGQNWDWIPDVQGAIVRTTDAEGFETLGFTEAGIVGTKIGLNTAGIGLGINGMTTIDDDMERMAKPFHVRCYEILRSRMLADAVNVIAGEGRSCSTNFLLAQAPDAVANVEAAPDVVNILGCTDGCLTHANHFVAPDAIGVKETPSERIGYSYARERRLRELLLAAKPLTVGKIQDALRNTENDPFGICRHRDLSQPETEHYTTVSSVVMDLQTRTIHLTDGAPDESPYQTVSLG